MKKDVYLFHSGTLKRKDNTLVYETNEQVYYFPIVQIRAIHVFGEISFNKPLINLLSKNGSKITQKPLRHNDFQVCIYALCRGTRKAPRFFYILDILSAFMHPCGNRKFTRPVANGNMKLYLGRSILGRSILGRMESNKGGVCPLPCSREGQRINV